MLQHSSSTRVSRRVWWSMATAVVFAMMPFQVVARTPSSPPPAAATIVADSNAAAPAPNAATDVRPLLPAPAELGRQSRGGNVSAQGDAGAEPEAIESGRQEQPEPNETLEREFAAALEQLERRYNPNHPDVMRLRRQLQALRVTANEASREQGQPADRTLEMLELLEEVAAAGQTRSDQQARMLLVEQQSQRFRQEQAEALLSERLAQITSQQQILIQQIETIAAQQAKLAEAQRQLSAQAEMIREIIERERQGSQRNAR